MGTSDPDIRLLSTGDLDGAFALSAGAGWNQRLADWHMLLQLAPAGSFAAVAGDRIIGTAIGIDYGTFGWVAMMLVDPAWRGQGVGARLLEEAMGAVPPQIPIRLDATPLGRQLYDRYGFEDETELTRHVAEPLDFARDRPLDFARDRPLDVARDRPSRPAVDPDTPPRPVRRLTPRDLSAVIARDDRVFGAPRRLLLEWALHGAAQYAHAIDSAAGVDYCFGRPGRLFDQIGPVVAADDDSARALVDAALRAAEGRSVVLDTFDRNAGFTAWLRSRGFTASRPLFRMRRAPRQGAATGSPAPPGASAEFAILGPEFG